MNLLSNKVAVFLLIVSFSCSSSSSQETQTKAVTISSQELSEILDQQDVQLVDVRTPEEVSYGIIPGAEHIDFYDPQFEEKVSKLDKDQTVAVYCAAGGRSAQAMSKLKDAGFTKIYNLGDGFRGWQQQGYPTTRQ